MALYLLRHAHTDWNGPPKRFQGRADVSLSSSGREQCLMKRETILKPDQIYVSPAKRCQETAQLVFPDHNVPTLDERLWEIDNGYFSGLLESEVEEKHPEEWKIWQATPAEIRPGGGELLSEMLTRILEALSEYLPKAQERDIVIVTHGGPIRLLKMTLAKQNLNNFHQTPASNLELMEVSTAAIEAISSSTK